MIDPITAEIQVAATPSDAFDTWTTRCGTWWPRTHTMARGHSDIVFEARAGGRIVEVEPDGTEHQWGRIVIWDPPHRLVYTWHIFLEPDQATTVEVTFTPNPSGCLVRLTNSGFEIFGEDGPPRAGRVNDAWRSILDGFAAALNG